MCSVADQLDKARGIRRRFHEQSHLVRSGEDLRVLKKAIASFERLQHIQILRVQYRDDEEFFTRVRSHAQAIGAPDFLHMHWGPACLHSARTIGQALAESVTPVQRFSSPMLDPESAISLAQQPPGLLPLLAHRLTCLELHFDGGADLDFRMQQLSPAFKAVFAAAVNLEAVHVGFPSHRPLSLPLESIFHDLQWDRLIAFGIQAWKLDSAEIVKLARRHHDKLRGLRLREVLLEEGSMWQDILMFLRDEMTRLDWVSLRRIGYARGFDEFWEHAGFEVPDDPPGGLSDSEDEEDDLYRAEFDHNGDADTVGSDSDQESTDTEGPDSDDGHSPQAHRMDFPPLPSPKSVASAWCSCNGHDRVEDLGDDGIFVDNMKRKAWEQWVLRRCPQHSPRG